METTEIDPERYRDEADRVRGLTDFVRDDRARAQLRAIADLYDDLADIIERDQMWPGPLRLPKRRG
jgi:hypothetical protein